MLTVDCRVKTTMDFDEATVETVEDPIYEGEPETVDPGEGQGAPQTPTGLTYAFYCKFVV